MNVRGEAYVSTVTVVSQSHTFKSVAIPIKL